MSPSHTIANLWRRAAEAGRNGPAYLVEHGDHFHEVSWAEAARAVEDLANGFLALGVKKGDAFAILARNHVEWAYADFALGSIGAIVSPIYPNSSPKDCAYILEHSESVGVVVEDEEQLAKIDRTTLRHVLTFDDLVGLRAKGREFAAANPGALSAASEAIAPDDIFTYIYTSGTTGPPKGCMIRHRNYYDMVAVVDLMETVVQPGDTMLLYLPLAHNYGRLLHLSAAYVGFAIAFCPDPLRVGEMLPTVRPTVLPSVPRVFEKVHTSVLASFADQTGAKQKLIEWSLGVGQQVSRLKQAQQPVPASLAFKHRVADKLVFGKVKARLGGRLRVANSGGAPLAKEIAEFFHALDVLIIEGYGLSECTTAATVNRVDNYKFGTVGLPLPNVELKIEEDGEILLRSPTVFAGYYKDPEATREVLDRDGWLRTGDIGQIDEDGFLTITDRKKDIIVTAGGKNVAPQNLENELKGSRFVSQALVIGDRRPYISALVTLDEPEIRKWAETQGIAGALPELARDDRVTALVQSIVDEVNENHSRYETIKRFTVLPRDFTADEGEVTPTLKLKRRVCQEHFADEVAALYS